MAMEDTTETATARWRRDGNGDDGRRGGNAMATEGATMTAGSSSKIT